MLSSAEFVRQSLELHLFFIRIMKEHSFFLEVGFTPKDESYSRQADAYRMGFDTLLSDAVALSNGVVAPEVLQSGEVVTPYTSNAEKLSSFFTGVRIPTQITQAETGLQGGHPMTVSNSLEQRVESLNRRAINIVQALIGFKTNILNNVLSCKMFTVNYPLLLDHILREAKLYLRLIQKLQSKENLYNQKEAYEQEAFWNRIMAEHSKFIRGLLDPTENALFNVADEFGKEFDQLTAEALEAIDKTLPLSKVTEDSLEATKRIRAFNEQGTQGLLNCKIKSIIIPLLGDHVLRESSHFLRLLRNFEKPL